MHAMAKLHEDVVLGVESAYWQAKALDEVLPFLDAGWRVRFKSCPEKRPDSLDDIEIRTAHGIIPQWLGAAYGRIV